MRLHEIYNESEIKRTFEKHFSIDGDYTIDENGLINVKGSCKLTTTTQKLPVRFNVVSHNFNCSGKELSTLEGCPKEVGNHFSCGRNHLISLQGGPTIIDRGDFDCTNNELTSFVGAPKIIPGTFRTNENKLTSLNDLPDEIHLLFNCDYYPTLPLLKICFSKVADIYLQPNRFSLESQCRDIEEILKRYAGTGKKGALQCAAELTKAGFKGNARL